MKDNFKIYEELSESKRKVKGSLVLEDGSAIEGYSFGYEKSVSGEVVFNTGMVGYPETLTDPSYRGQILTLTYPLIGNYGIPQSNNHDQSPLPVFESHRIQVQGLVVSQYSNHYSHWLAHRSLSDWLKEHRVPALTGIDTRMLTKRLREKGTMPGKIVIAEGGIDFYDPGADNLVALVSIKRPITYKRGKTKVLLLDCGCKNSILYSLLNRNMTVLRVPFDYDFLKEDFDGLLISNGPGNPQIYQETIARIREAMRRKYPIFGICLGHQLLSLAAGADTFKLKFGHRSQNQPCVEVGTQRCYITSQNHGYAVVNESLPSDWETWFVNANDGTNEGIRCTNGPFMSVQFHPEAAPGPVDTNYLFDTFQGLLNG